MRANRLHKEGGGGLITLIRDTITFTTTYINTYNTELQMIHINDTKHITIANIDIPPRDSTSTNYKTADTDIQHCILQYITNIPHSVLIGDVNAHFTLWHLYTDDNRLQQNRRTFTNYKKADWTQSTAITESAFAQTTIPTNIHTANIIFTNIILMEDKHNIPKGKMHRNCRLLPDLIVCKSTQRNNIRRVNTCDQPSNS